MPLSGDPLKSQASSNRSRISRPTAPLHQQPGCIMRWRATTVSEGSGQNLFLVRDGTLYTPPVDGALLPGITRDCVITLAREREIRVHIAPIPREALYIADELFFTGTASEVSPIRSVDRIPVGRGKPGPVARQLHQDLMDVAKGIRPDRYEWLSPVRSAPAPGESVPAEAAG